MMLLWPVLLEMVLTDNIFMNFNCLKLQIYRNLYVRIAEKVYATTIKINEIIQIFND